MASPHHAASSRRSNRSEPYRAGSRNWSGSKAKTSKCQVMKSTHAYTNEIYQVRSTYILSRNFNFHASNGWIALPSKIAIFDAFNWTLPMFSAHKFAIRVLQHTTPSFKICFPSIEINFRTFEITRSAKRMSPKFFATLETLTHIDDACHSRRCFCRQINTHVISRRHH